jgi:hypothetical protein
VFFETTSWRLRNERSKTQHDVLMRLFTLIVHENTNATLHPKRKLQSARTFRG